MARDRLLITLDKMEKGLGFVFTRLATRIYDVFAVAIGYLLFINGFLFLCALSPRRLLPRRVNRFECVTTIYYSRSTWRTFADWKFVSVASYRQTCLILVKLCSTFSRLRIAGVIWISHRDRLKWRNSVYAAPVSVGKYRCSVKYDRSRVAS